ncbi:MAG: hypothetical protein IJ730_00805 [Alphaproteobacteria bacterium]|nr:hypothetical protein [Alphaproteobacteria bacterium]
MRHCQSRFTSAPLLDCRNVNTGGAFFEDVVLELEHLLRIFYAQQHHGDKCRNQNQNIAGILPIRSQKQEFFEKKADVVQPPIVARLFNRNSHNVSLFEVINVEYKQ